jgi:hypothetical protein
METFSRSMLPPYGFSVSVQANAVEYPRALSGRAAANDFTAGGYVMAEFQQIPVVTPAQFRYWNRIARKYSGGRAGIIVPIINDDLLPDGVPAGTSGISHSDGALFSDGSGYAQDSISGSLVGDHILNAGTLTFEFFGDAELTGGEWFSIRHPTKNWRAYSIWTIDDTEDVSGGGTLYTVGIQPPLREATAGGTDLDFVRPRFLGQMGPDTTLQTVFDASDLSRGSVSFVERFEVA